MSRSIDESIFADFSTPLDLDAFNSTSAWTGADPLTDEEIEGMTVGEYRSIINDGIAAVQQIDWGFILSLANDPQYASFFDIESLAFIREAAGTNGSSLVGLFNDALSYVDGYPSSTLLGDITGDYSTDFFDESDFDDIRARFDDKLDDAYFEVQESDAGSFFESPTFEYDPQSDIWQAYDEFGDLDLSGDGENGFLGIVGDIFGDAVVSMLGEVPGFFGSAVSTGTTISDLAEARQVGADAGQEFGDLLQFAAEDVFNGDASLADLDARTEQAAQNFISGLIGLVPGGSFINGIFFGSQNSDATFQFGNNAALLEGSEHGDRFIFSNQSDEFEGGVGKDALFGMGGADVLSGQNDVDILSGGAGHDTLSGGSGDDSLLGGSGRDVLRGNKDNDVLFGGDGNDRLFGQAGQDTLTSGSGDDVSKGGGGSDEIFGDNGDDFLKGGTGNDGVRGGRGNDTIAGNRGDDTLEGFDGRDKLNGGGGDDLLIGGAGNDTLKGGAGSDTFQFGSGFGTDLVKDFTSDDLLFFVGFGALDLAQLRAASDVVNGDLRIDLGDGGVFWLEDADQSMLTELTTDFL